jgi:DNA polymerase-4
VTGTEAPGGGPSPPWPADARAILHVDMDAFFVSVELLRHPELRGRPVVVGGAGARGVVAAASYEARAYGVHSAMASVQAKRRCPQAVFLSGDHGEYSRVSREVMAVFAELTPLVEPLSLDEAFLDVSGSRRLHGDPIAMAHALRVRVLDEVGLPCSVGVARNKFLAKLASDEAKPRASLAGPVPGEGVTVVWPDRELAFLHPLPVQRLWGVGPATLERLGRLGVVSVGDLAALPVEVVVAQLGEANGRHLYALAHATDDRPVEPERAPKSVGHEETFAVDHHSIETLEVEAVRMADAVASRLRGDGLAGRTITLKVKFADFRLITRSTTLAGPTDRGADVIREAKRLLAGVDPTPGIRLLGVSVSNFDGEAAQQLALALDAAAPSDTDRDGAERAVDEIRGRFGGTAIGPASSLTAGGLRVKRRGDQQWGPDDERGPSTVSEGNPPDAL